MRPSIVLSVGMFSLALAAQLPSACTASPRPHGTPETGLVWAVRSTPFRHDFHPPLQVDGGQELVVEGENPHQDNVTLHVRIDDGQSHDYMSRVNIERVLPPGPFRFRLPLSGLQTPQPYRRSLDAADIRALFVFVNPDAPAVALKRVAMTPAPKLPTGAIGWDFGTPNSPVFPGFKQVTPTTPGVQGKALKAMQRPAGDALIADGIKGIDHFEAHVPNGLYHISLWTEDYGEWEYIPHALQQQIVVQGRSVLTRRQPVEAWLRDTYFKHRDTEVTHAADPWTLYAADRGGVVHAVAQVHDGRLRIELRGDSPPARYLAAVLLEPAPGRTAFDAVTQERRRRYLETWRVDAKPPRWKEKEPRLLLLPPAAEFGQALKDHRKQHKGERVFAAAPGTPVSIDFALLTPNDQSAVKVTVHPAEATATREHTLPASLRWGFWRFERPQPASMLLVPTADHLRGDMENLRTVAHTPRRLNLRVYPPADTPPGLYRGSLVVRLDDGTLLEQKYGVRILPVRLPQLPKPIGAYLARAPHLEWFPELQAHAGRAVGCDLDTLRREGLTGVAPPLTAPRSGQHQAFAADLRRVYRRGYSPEILAYGPLATMAFDQSIDAIAAQLKTLSAGLQQLGMLPPIWSIADEPQDNPTERQVLRHWSTTLRQAVRGIKLAGHLNARSHTDLVELFDIVLVNHGYGLDARRVEAIQRKGVETWLYNMPKKRLGAGFYAWRLGVAGYMQWHGRMPTADPYDPTDGRETDFHMVFPTPDRCPANADVHTSLFDIAEAVTDARWLLWLENEAKTRPAARALLERLRQAVPTDWDSAAKLSDEAPRDWRQQILQLAQPRRAKSTG